MAKTDLWDDYGDSILAAPYLTLAAFLGHKPSMTFARKNTVLFPAESDFKADRAYDPNPHKLKLPADTINSKFLIQCISTWGAEPLVLAAHVCSKLQCHHQRSSLPEVEPIQTEAASVLQELIDSPSSAIHTKANAVLLKCQTLYRQYAKSPDSVNAQQIWYDLGAPWFGLETVLGNLEVRSDCGETEPAPSNSTWCNRVTVWPERAIDAAAHWSSHAVAQVAVRSALIEWVSGHLQMILP